MPRITFTVGHISEFTGISDIGGYLTLLAEIDAFFLNEDRHTNNIAVIKNDDSGEMRTAPIFDNGLALLSDTNDYSFGDDIEKNIEKITAKPFSTDFDEQLDAAEELYGQQIKFSFTRNDVDRILDSAADFYSEDIINRVKELLYRRMRKYSYFFS